MFLPQNIGKVFQGKCLKNVPSIIFQQCFLPYYFYKVFLPQHFSKFFVPWNSVKCSYCNNCRSLLQGHIYVPEAVAVRNLQHLHTSLQPCCVGHPPRHDGCPVLRSARGSENTRSHQWLSSNSTAFCQWLRADTNRSLNTKRLALCSCTICQRVCSFHVPTHVMFVLILWPTVTETDIIFVLSIHRYISENCFRMPVDCFSQTLRSLLLGL